MYDVNVTNSMILQKREDGLILKAYYNVSVLKVESTKALLIRRSEKTSYLSWVEYDDRALRIHANGMLKGRLAGIFDARVAT